MGGLRQHGEHAWTMHGTMLHAGFLHNHEHGCHCFHRHCVVCIRTPWRAACGRLIQDRIEVQPCTEGALQAGGERRRAAAAVACSASVKPPVHPPLLLHIELAGMEGEKSK